MAESYYGYVPYLAESQVNWASLGKSLTGMISDEAKRREEKKAELEKINQSIIEQADKSPTGINQDATKFTADLVAETKTNNLLLTRGLKSGKIDPKDYMIQAQNMKRGLTSLFDMSTKVQDTSATVEKGLKDGTLTDIDNYKYQQILKLANLQNTKAFYAEDGSLHLVDLTDIDPKTNKPREKSAKSVDALFASISVTSPRYDTDKAVNSVVDKLGTVNISTVIKNAGINTAGIMLDTKNPQYLTDDQIKNLPLDDKEKNLLKGFRDAYLTGETNEISTVTSDPNKMLSILTMDLNKYTVEDFTEKEEEAKADPRKIFIRQNKNGQYEMVKDGPNYDKHLAEVEEYLRTKIRSKEDIDLKEQTDLNAVKKPASTGSGSKDSYDNPITMDTVYTLMRSNNPVEIEKAMTLMPGLKYGDDIVRDIKQNPNGTYNIYMQNQTNDKFGVDLRSYSDEQGLASFASGDKLSRQDYIDFYAQSPAYKELKQFAKQTSTAPIVKPISVGSVISSFANVYGYKPGVDAAIVELKKDPEIKRLKINIVKDKKNSSLVKLYWRNPATNKIEESEFINLATDVAGSKDNNNKRVKSFFLKLAQLGATAQNQFKTKSGIEYSIIPTEQNQA